MIVCLCLEKQWSPDHTIRHVQVKIDMFKGAWQVGESKWSVQALSLLSVT